MSNRYHNNVEFRFNGAQWYTVSHGILLYNHKGQWGVNWAGLGTKTPDEAVLYGQALIAAGEFAAELNRSPANKD